MKNPRLSRGINTTCIPGAVAARDILTSEEMEMEFQSSLTMVVRVLGKCLQEPWRETTRLQETPPQLLELKSLYYQAKERSRFLYPDMSTTCILVDVVVIDTHTLGKMKAGSLDSWTMVAKADAAMVSPKLKQPRLHAQVLQVAAVELPETSQRLSPATSIIYMLVYRVGIATSILERPRMVLLNSWTTGAKTAGRAASEIIMIVSMAPFEEVSAYIHLSFPCNVQACT